MSMPKGSLLSVLAYRVLQNLQFVEAFAPPWDPASKASDEPPFADTQLVVSLLGILIFPHERTPDALGDLLDGYKGQLDQIIRIRYSTAKDGVVLSSGDGVTETVDPIPDL